MEIVDYLLARKKAGGGSDVTIEQLSVTENGTYSEQGIAYSPVVVNVPAPENSYQLIDIPAGTVSTIEDGTDLPMSSLKVGIEPVQEGSGDPSPENIRPISGWTAANVTRTGKNICPGTYNIGMYDVNGVYVNSNNYRSTDKFAVIPNTQYTSSLFNSVNTRINSLVAVEFDKNKNPLKIQNVTSSFTTSPNTYYISLRNFDVNISDVQSENFHYQLELGSTTTTYEPYTGTTYNIQFTDGTNPLTVYGGTLDVTSGELAVDRKLVNMGNLSWAYDTSYDRFVSNNIPDSEPPSGARITSFISSIYEVIDDGRPISQVTSGQMYSSFDSTQTSAIVMVHDNRFTDATEFKTAVTGQTFVYELATPTTYHLTPAQVRTLVGTNNIWADTGDVLSGKYFKEL